MSSLRFNHIYAPAEYLTRLQADPEGYLEGLFSVPEEITAFDEGQITEREYRSKTDGFRVGYIYARNWAMKNARVKIQGVENV